MSSKKTRKNEKRKEERVSGFKCSHCHFWVPVNESIGTAHRDHCSFCLWSKHVDLGKPGDRKSECKAGMEPIGLTFKQEGWDKAGKLRQGELMLIHQCTQCDKISINRIAADDSLEAIISLFETSQRLDPEMTNRLEKDDIRLLTENDREEIMTQLYGKK